MRKPLSYGDNLRGEIRFRGVPPKNDEIARMPVPQVLFFSVTKNSLKIEEVKLGIAILTASHIRAK